jgi:hypothetical protein
MDFGPVGEKIKKSLFIKWIAIVVGATRRVASPCDLWYRYDFTGKNFKSP